MATELLAPGPAALMAATLDWQDKPPGPGDPLPPLWHWLYFLEGAPARELGPDGHQQHGDFLPPLPLPRRMWAGGRLDFRQPLHIGETVRKETLIEDVQLKQGRGGALVFITVRQQTPMGAKHPSASRTAWIDFWNCSSTNIRA